MNSNTVNYFLNLGFNQNEINLYKQMLEYNERAGRGGKLTPQKIQSYLSNIGMANDGRFVKKICYMNNIYYNNGISIESEQDMITHFQKMTGLSRSSAKEIVYEQNLKNGYGAQHYSKDELIKHLKVTNGRQKKITMADLQISKFNEIPRYAVVDGIMNEPYNFFNFKRHMNNEGDNNGKAKQAIYKVIAVSGQNITVESMIWPKIQHSTPLNVDGVINIHKGKTQKGTVIVDFNKQYCRLCNRFAIVASLRRPERHLGMFEIICFEGTKVYVYATNIGTKQRVSNSGTSLRTYSFGIFPRDIKGKLTVEAANIYKRLNGVSRELIEANDKYSWISRQAVEEEDMQDEIDF